jgi:hypothetical protein
VGQGKGEEGDSGGRYTSGRLSRKGGLRRREGGGRGLRLRDMATPYGPSREWSKWLMKSL